MVKCSAMTPSASYANAVSSSNALGVGQLFLYGSVARNQAREDSDVDLLVEPSNQRFSIFDLVRLRDLCRTILGTHRGHPLTTTGCAVCPETPAARRW